RSGPPAIPESAAGEPGRQASPASLPDFLRGRAAPRLRPWSFRNPSRGSLGPPEIGHRSREMHQMKLFAHSVQRFRSAEKKIAPRYQVAVETPDGPAFGLNVEINEHVVSYDKFQTCSMICARVTCCPTLRMRYSSSENAFG